MQNAQIGDGRTAKLTKEDKKKLSSLVKKAETVTAAAGVLKVSRQSLTTIIKSGTCAPTTLQAIRKLDITNMAAAS